MTDLKNVQDHPAHIVQNLNTIGPRPGAWGTSLTVLHYAAADLRQYETDHEVTFAALDNDTLRTLREVYNEAPSSEHTQDDLNAVLRGLMNDLLGLDDE